MKTDPDAQLMLEFKNGNENSFRKLFLKYQKRMINFCYRFCLDRELAEDMAQEVFLRIYKAGPRYRPEARFSSWAYRIAVNVCLNETRKKRYKYRIESIDQPVKTTDGDISREIADPRYRPDHDAFELKEREQMMQVAIRGLPEKQRIALLLRVYDGSSYREIAKQMDISETRVKGLIHKGRRRLRQILVEDN